MALLFALHRAGHSGLVACHVNHGLRGPASDKDEALVRRTCGSLGMDCRVRRVDVAEFAQAEKLSLETAARELRYRELAAVARETGTANLLLGHHADDQVETVLINFFRGSGTRGLSGMAPVSSRTIDGDEYRLLRPFLSLPRSEIDQFIETHSISFRDDASNEEDFALRNRIRNRLLPDLEDIFGRDVRDAVLRSSELSRRLESWAAKEEGALPEKDGGLDVEALRELRPAHRERLILRWLRESGIPDCGFAEVNRVVEILLSDTNPAKVNLPGGHHARRRAGILFLEFPDAAIENQR